MDLSRVPVHSETEGRYEFARAVTSFMDAKYDVLEVFPAMYGHTGGVEGM